MVNVMNLRNIIFVHRGKINSKLNENSLDAFKFCVDKKMNIELDLHILKDNTVVVFYDDNLKRIYNKDIHIKNLNYQELIRECGQEILTLSEVLSIVNGKVILDIELKYDVLNGKLEEEVIRILKNYKGEFILKSFHPLIVWRLKRLVRKNGLDIKVGLLAENSFLLILSYIFIHPEFYAVNYKCLKKFIFKFISKRKDTLLYTIKSKYLYEKYKDKGYGLILENFNEF